MQTEPAITRDSVKRFRSAIRDIHQQLRALSHLTSDNRDTAAIMQDVEVIHTKALHIARRLDLAKSHLRAEGVA